MTPTTRSPLCVFYPRHCGAYAVYGKPVVRKTCVNRTIRCVRCGATGVESTRRL